MPAAKLPHPTLKSIGHCEISKANGRNKDQISRNLTFDGNAHNDDMMFLLEKRSVTINSCIIGPRMKNDDVVKMKKHVQTRVQNQPKQCIV